MKSFWLIVLLYFAMVAQGSLASEIVIGTITPDFLLMVLVAAIVLLDGWPAIVWAAMIGLAADCLAPDQLGLGMVAATIAALTAQRLRGDRAVESAVWMTIAMFFIVLGITLGLTLVRVTVTNYRIDWQAIALVASGTAVYSTAIMFAIVIIWRTVKHLLPKCKVNDAANLVNRWKMLTD